MRTRNKSYKYYGLSKEDIEKVFEICQNADEEQKKIIQTALYEIKNPYIRQYVSEGLISRKSYDKLLEENGKIAILKEDFYAYRRQAIEAVKRYMIWNKLW